MKTAAVTNAGPMELRPGLNPIPADAAIAKARQR